MEEAGVWILSLRLHKCLPLREDNRLGIRHRLKAFGIPN